MSKLERRPLILYVITSLHEGGSQRHLAEVIPVMAGYGFSVEIFAFRRTSTIDTFIRQGVRIAYPFGSKIIERFPQRIRFLGIPLIAISLFTYLVRRRPSVVHAFLPAPCILGIPIAFLARTRVRIGSRRSLDDYQKGRSWVRLAERGWFLLANAVLGNSRAVVQQLLDGGAAPAKTALIYNGIAGERFERPAEIRAAVRRSFDIGETEFTLIKVATLIDYKGHADLLRALRTCDSDLPSWKLVCVGRDEGEGSHLRALAQRLRIDENVLWLGERDDVPDLLSAADAMVLTSHQEGFPNSVVEGMAAGLAIVATDVGGVREAIEDGSSGILVPPHNPDELAQALLSIANDQARRSQLSLSAKARQKANFGLDECTRRYRSLYDSLLGGRGIPRDMAVSLAG